MRNEQESKLFTRMFTGVKVTTENNLAWKDRNITVETIKSREHRVLSWDLKKVIVISRKQARKKYNEFMSSTVFHTADQVGYTPSCYGTDLVQ